MRLVLTVGIALSGLFGAVAAWFWGRQAGIAGVAFGLLATAIQLSAIGLIKPAEQAPIKLFLKRWGMGMALRLLGVVAIALAAGLDPVHFPPLAAATGFLGVLVPLLFFEARRIR